MIENDRISDFRISVVVSNVYRHNLTWQDLLPKVASFHSSFARRSFIPCDRRSGSSFSQARGKLEYDLIAISNLFV